MLAVIGLCIILFVIFNLKLTVQALKDMANDTLKRQDQRGVWRWSRTSLTMFTAWCVALYMVFYDLYNNGFHYEVFLTLSGVALGSKLTDKLGQKLSPDKEQKNNDLDKG